MDRNENPGIDVETTLTHLQMELFREANSIIDADRERYGTTLSLTKEGFLALARAGADVWNEWRRHHADQTPDFSGIDFRNDPIDFSEFNFNTHFGQKHSVNFEGAIFGDVDFSSAKFGRNTNFDNAIFCGNADFNKAKFSGKLSFRGAEFQGKAIFWRSNLGLGACFDRAVFHQAAIFTAAGFEDVSTLEFCTFNDGANFSAATAENAEESMKSFKSISFCGSIFKGDADFSGRTFLSTTNFGDLEYDPSRQEISKKKRRPVEFHGIAKFHACKLHQDTSFDGAIFNAPQSQEAARAYRTLKLAMEQLKATREEQRFFRLEMQAEHSSLHWSRQWISTAYSVTSDYGFSLFRPFLTLIFLTILFGIAHGILANLHTGEWLASGREDIDQNRTLQWFRYVLINMLPVPGLDKTQIELRDQLFGTNESLVSAAITIEIAHKILSLGCAFLMGLGLRNLFKMKP